MTWNHRVLRHVVVLDSTHEVGFTIREVYYDDDGNPTGWTDAVGPAGESLEDLVADHMRMASAFEKPILENVDGKLIEWKDPAQ